MKNKVSRQQDLFIYLLLLTGIFLLLEISFAMQGSGIYLGDFEYISSHLQIPCTVLPGIFFYLCAQLALHLGFTVLVWGVARWLGAVLAWPWSRIEKLGFGLWGMGLITILIANEYLFPNSKFADLTSLLIPQKIVAPLYWFFIIAWASALTLCFLLVMLRSRKWAFSVAAFIISISWLMWPPSTTKLVHDAATAQRPNIILIGVDALRPDFINARLTPHLQAFLEHAAVFDAAYTPLARTFPAWVSILTGNYPKNNGVRFDLADQQTLDLRGSLPALLQAQGYKTVYAMDETRFSNMGKNFGFDKVITPPMGFNDFLLGTFNDFPLSNLLVNSKVGKWLFPYSYANRPAFITYQPNSFLKLLQPELAQDRTQPLFFAVHFCLTHYPYFWATYSPSHTTEAVAHYQAAIQRSDKLVYDFLMILKKDGLLEHSIVVLLSDHGEALELDGDRVTDANKFIAGVDNTKHVIPHFYPPSFDFEKVNQSAGHGTDVLGLTQYHSVLAFSFTGVAERSVRRIPDTVSLMDIKPTLLAALNIPFEKIDGNSRLANITGATVLQVKPSDFFMESDFSPAAVRSVHPELRAVVLEGLDFFHIDPLTTQLTVKNQMAAVIISSKQFADIYGKWELALYPQGPHCMIPILVNLQTGNWTNDLHSAFAQQSPATHMLQALQQFYGVSLEQITGSNAA
jgi:arylsulfatase A-like enzyme